MNALAFQKIKIGCTNFFEDFFKMNTWVAFILLGCIYIITQFIQQRYIFVDAVYYNSFGEQMTSQRITEWVATQEKMGWLSLGLIPLILFFQILMTAICLSVGAVVMEYKITFQQFFKVATKATIIFGISKIVYTFILLFMDISTFDDVLKADYFSLLGIAKNLGYPEWLLYPFSVINVFELCFVVLLSFGVNIFLKKGLIKVFQFIVLSYGLGLLAWMLLVVFFQLTFS